jgi:hypothetical protein
MDDSHLRKEIPGLLNKLYKDASVPIMGYADLREFSEAFVVSHAHFDEVLVGVPEAYAAQANHTSSTSMKHYGTSGIEMGDFNRQNIHMFQLVSRVCALHLIL